MKNYSRYELENCQASARVGCFLFTKLHVEERYNCKSLANQNKESGSENFSNLK